MPGIRPRFRDHRTSSSVMPNRLAIVATVTCFLVLIRVSLASAERAGVEENDREGNASRANSVSAEGDRAGAGGGDAGAERGGGHGDGALAWDSVAEYRA